MLWFYDGQVRRYITQIMRLMSNFGVNTGNNNIRKVPVMYGNLTRQVANIIRENSENKIPSAPRISVYITGLDQDRDRTSDATYIRKTNIRERAFNEQTNQYLNSQGKNYTVERLMPTPYTLQAKCDIWTTNTDQKLQLLEQILVLFNPSLEIQTTDNFVDWTSLTVVNLESIEFSSTSIPVGTESEIDIASIGLSTPIYISPPAAVKQMNVITNIITSIFDEKQGTVDLGLTVPELNQYDDYIISGATQSEYGRVAETDLAKNTANVNFQNYGIFIQGNTARIISQGRIGITSWQKIFEYLPGTFQQNLSKIYLTNLDTNSLLIGTLAFEQFEEKTLTVNWDTDTFPGDTAIEGRTSIDFIIDPIRFNPLQDKVAGLRLLTLGDIGSNTNQDGPVAWKNSDGSNFVAGENDIIEWNGSNWIIVFDSSKTSEIVYTTNLKTGQQYRFKNNEWLLSVDGEYPIGTWRISLDG